MVSPCVRRWRFGGLASDDGGNVGAQISVVLYAEEARVVPTATAAPLRRRRQERHLESGLLCDTATGGQNCGYASNKKEQRVLVRYFHLTASVMKIKYFREP